MPKLEGYSVNGYVGTQIRRLNNPGIVNVWDYRSSKSSGIMCDGTDDYPAFAAARDSVPSGEAVRIHVPRGTYLLNTSVFDNGRTVYVDQEEGVTITGAGIIYTSSWIQRTGPREQINRRGTPAGGYNTLGEIWNYTNTTGTPGYGQRFNYVNDGTPVSGYDIAYGLIANWKGMAGGQALCNWYVFHTPNSSTWTGGFVWAEINPVNRGDDKGWIKQPGALNRWIGALRIVPESQDFTGSGGTGRHITFGVSLSRSNSNNADGVKTRTYTGYMIEPDAIAPSGYGAYWNGSTSGTTSEWYGALGLEGSFRSGLDFTAAAFLNTQAIRLNGSDKIAWVTSSTERAYILGANGYLALNPGSTGYITATVPDSGTSGGNARGANAVDMQNTRGAATQVASGAQSTIAGGQNNTASSLVSTVGGGFGNTASANSACVPGGNTNTANGSFSVATGSSSNARSQHGKVVHSAGPFAGQGDAQVGVNVLRMSTTDATATPMSANGSAPSSTTVVALPNNSVYAFSGEIISRNTSTNDAAMWTVSGLIKRGASAATTAFVGSPTVTRVFNDAGAAWTVAATADTTNGGLTFTVTGEAAKTIRWVANIRTTEVA